MTVAKAVWNQIQSNDHRLMRRVHRWRAPRWFRILMILMTRLGDGWLWYSLGLILVLYGGEHRFAAIGAGMSAAAAGIFLFRVLKRARELSYWTNWMGRDPAAGQVFVSFRTFHHRICDRVFRRLFLS
jgi:hypothetical protein